MTTRWLAPCAVAGLLVGLLAGCDGDPKPMPSPAAPTTGSGAPAPASSVPTGAPLGTAAYQDELGRIDQVLAKPLQALTRVRTAEGLGEAMTTLTQSFNTVTVRLAELRVASRLSVVHQLLQDRIGVAASRLGSSVEETENDARCGGVAHTSQKVQRQLRSDLSPALAHLERLRLTFGSTLPDQGPAPRVERPENGTVLVRRGPNGTGRLKVTNGTSTDVAISIVADGQPPSSPQVMVYIRAAKSATVSRVGGAYYLYFKSGSDWDAGTRSFRADCSFKKFDQTFTRNQGWQVDLQPRPTGNAATTEVEAY